ncbi:hypothetical protein PF005_g1243 [Phytophthora fragariae]|uniref:RxLR effector protein n=2 Tax=Phytophthora TaxID=4783 RepID=A0A6A3TQX1_9STRA|nr:hypothetical protein PF003_g20646 [Phytophthora fragariae]KAE8985557.1 hypothetical protein PR002_g22608 [Phytophthora rubi]KAE8950176.1 hypothetical protein PF009_g315 [Phytophthora fragariae]KAE9031384.1 hypothetical protein PF011_g175 [Phytophthora fragariae]KAE9140627.1 hypothetical protein PF010_g69 [Phytophthora fragariae]
MQRFLLLLAITVACNSHDELPCSRKTIICAPPIHDFAARGLLATTGFRSLE